MREITKEIIGVFERNAMSNAKEIGIDHALIFGEEKLSEFLSDFMTVRFVSDCDTVKKEELPFYSCEPAFCSFIRVSDNLHGEELRRHLRSVAFMPEGTTVVFTHSEDMKKTERLMSEEGFRTIEHFNADRAGEGAFGIIEKDMRENTCFCLGVRKQHNKKQSDSEADCFEFF